MGGSSNPTQLPGTRNQYWIPIKKSAVKTSDTIGFSIPVPGNSLIKYPDALLLQELLVTNLMDAFGVKIPVPIYDSINNAQKAYGLLMIWVRSYIKQYTNPDAAWSAFRLEWRTYRLVIPLQVRLMTEQVLYDMGYPWRAAYTGFNPMKE